MGANRANRVRKRGILFVYIDSTLVVPVRRDRANSNAIRFDTLLGLTKIDILDDM